MTEPGLPVPIEEQEDTFLRNIHRLFFRPRVYFEGINAPKKAAWLYIFSLTCALAYAIDRMAMNSIQGRPDPKSWAEHWMILGIGGLIGMFLVHSVGCAFYRFRLRMCGTPQEDKDLVRMVYLSAAQIYAIPTIVAAVAATVQFEDPTAAAIGEAPWIGWVTILFALRSYWASYVGVRTVFKAPKLRAAMWFFILPVAANLLVIGGAFLLARAGLFFTAPRPEIGAPLEFSGPGMAFSYPGNWRITDSEPDPEVEATAEIQGQGGFYVSIQILESTGDPEAIADDWAESTTEFITDATPVEPFGAWGTLTGAGRAFEGQAEGDVGLDVACKVRMFVAPVADGRVIMILEILPKATAAQIEPGLALIRRTFRTATPQPPASDVSDPTADVEGTREFDNSLMTFSYPQGWKIVEIKNTSLVPEVQVQSLGDGFMSLKFDEARDGVEAGADSWSASLRKLYKGLAERGTFEEWGDYDGAGRLLAGEVDGVGREIRLFVAPVADGRALMVMEMFPPAMTDTDQAGFDLIRRTFEPKR